MKAITFYLPQFYQFPENDEWWGEGFTEWTNVKKAKPLFKGHYQPTIPLNKNFYSLDDINTMKWQAEIAQRYGIYGFCFYHYWFGCGRQLMEKPVDAWLKHKEIKFPFCLCWANHNWSRTWLGSDKDILMDMNYGNEDEWEAHLQYLLPFFKDDRYITIANKPALIIYLPQTIPCFEDMIMYIKRRMKEEGFLGITIISQGLFEEYKHDNLIDYQIQYEPNCSRQYGWNHLSESFVIAPSFVIDIGLYRLKGLIKKATRGRMFNYRTLNYDTTWKYILRRPVKSKKEIAGAFVKCDVTPRRQERALIYKGSTPEKFHKYLKKLNDKMVKHYSTDFVFISAWNEWGEGMYLEPDEKSGYKYLEAVLDVIKEDRINDKGSKK